MLQRAAQYLTPGRAAETGDRDQAEQQFGPAFADKELPSGALNNTAMSALALSIIADKRMRGRIVTPLVVRDRRHSCRRLDHGIQRQRAAGVLKEDALSLERAGIYMGKAASHGAQQVRGEAGD